MLNKPTIPFYSFEPPTAFVFSDAVFFFGGLALRQIVYFFMLLIPVVGWGDLASVSYVESHTATHVDTAQSANQTMAGTYTVSGTLIVPTPPLPSAE